MSKPSTSTVPFTRASGTSSCIRVRQRTKVDLPHPGGPIIAVTVCGSTERLISKSACFRPYQASRCCTVKAMLYFLLSHRRTSTVRRLPDSITLASELALESTGEPAHCKRRDEDEQN